MPTMPAYKPDDADLRCGAREVFLAGASMGLEVDNEDIDALALWLDAGDVVVSSVNNGGVEVGLMLV